VIADRRTLLHLQAVRNTLANDLRADLKSGNSKDLLDHAVLLLNQMITELESGPQLGAAYLPVWSKLCADFAGLAHQAATAPVALHHSGSALDPLDDVFAALRARMVQAYEQNLLSALADPASPASAWFSRAVGAAASAVDWYEAKVSQAPEPSANGVFATEEELRTMLSAFLRTRFPQLPADPILAFRLVPGGRAKRTAIFQLRDNESLPVRLVLRSDTAAVHTGTTVADEFPLLERLHAEGLPVPKPLLVERDVSILGGTFMLVEEVVDAVVAGEPFPEERRRSASGSRNMGPEFGAQVAQFLARLHSTTRRTANATAQIDAEVRRAYEQWNSIEKPSMSIGIDLGFAWLMSHPLPDDRPQCIVHGDFGSHNLLSRHGNLVTVLDWELTHVGDPAADFGDSRRMLLDELMPWRDFVAAYVRAGGDPAACDAHAVRYYSIWRFTKHGAMTAVLRRMFLDGTRGGDVLAAGASWHFGQRLHRLCIKELHAALNEPED
jgi:aminoglycoside phosphotransferase (APT) family kinase protein